jgi:hypothetical protein
MSFLGSLTGANDIQNEENLFNSQGGSSFAAGGGNITSGTNTMAPALQFLTQLTKGDQGDVSQAAQPQIDSITQQFDQIRNMISQQPRGGGKTTALAEAPFQKSAAINRTEGDLRSGAASSLANAGLGVANLGLGQEGLGSTLEGQGFAAAQAKPSLLNQLSSLVNFAGNTASTVKGISDLFPSGGSGGGGAGVAGGGGGGSMDDPGGLF